MGCFGTGVNAPLTLFPLASQDQRSVAAAIGAFAMDRSAAPSRSVLAASPFSSSSGPARCHVGRGPVRSGGESGCVRSDHSAAPAVDPTNLRHNDEPPCIGHGGLGGYH